MKKIISITLAVTTICWMAGVVAFAPVASAITIVEGDIVSPDAEYTDADGNDYFPYDVFIIKYMGDKKFKRLVLNPQVFDSYEHLEWANIKTATVAEVQAFTTSEIVRADGDDKVYKLFPDGDTGIKKWVETLDCFTTNSYDWDSVYMINSTDRDNYTTGAGMCGGGDGDITLSLGSGTAPAASIPYNSAGVSYLEVNVTGSGTISQMVFKRSGVGEAADFNNVYLYEGDNRLTSGRSVSSSTNKTTFIGLSVSAPTTLTLVADLAASSGDNGHISAFSLESASDVTSDATVGGTFPITGNLLAITSIQGGTLTVVDNGSIGNPTVGQSQAQITQFKVTGAREAIDISRITIYNGGNMNSTEITNLELKDVSGTVLATADAFNSDDLGTFVFDTPYHLLKGNNKIFKLYGDLAGDKDDTIILYFEVSADIKGTGASYGHGVEVDISGMDSTTTGESHTLTLEGGELTIAFNGPIAADIGDDTDDTVFIDFSFTAASNLEIRKMQTYMCFYEEGTLHNIDAATEHIDEVEDIKLKDKDTGTILMGPTDGSGFGLSTVNVCGTSAYGAYKEWTDIWDLDAGETKNLQITGDIETSAAGATDTDPGDQWKAVLRGYTNLTNPIKYRGTNDYVAAADIVPSTDIAGNLMTIQSSSIAVALGGIPTSIVDGVKSQEGVTAMALLFTAGDASDMELTDLVLSAWVGDVTGAYTEGLDSGGPYAKEVITNITLYESDGTTKLSDGGPKGFSGGTNDSNVTFDNLSWTVSAGTSKKMLVKVDITTTATSSTYDFVYFDIDVVGDVTAIDNEGNSSNPSSVDLQTEDSPTVYVRKSDGGTLTAAVTVAGIRPEQTFVYQGQEGAMFSKFKFTSTLEAFQIDKMTIELDSSGSGDENNMTKVELEYPIDAAGTLVSPRPAGYFAGTASITFNLTGKEMYIPKDDYAYVTVYADLTTYTLLSDQTLDAWPLSFEGDGITTFHATGVGSSKVYKGNDTGIDDAAGVSMYLYRTFPTFTLDNSTGATHSSMSAVDKIFEFTITNNGDYDLVFNTASGELIFDVLGSGEITGNPVFKLYKFDGTAVSSATVTAAGAGAASADFTTFDSTITIPEGGSQAMYIQIDSGNSYWDEKGDWLQLKLRDEVGGDAVVKWDDGNAGDLDAIWVLGTKEIGIPISGPVWNVSW